MNRFLSGFYDPLTWYAYFTEKVHPWTDALIFAVLYYLCYATILMTLTLTVPLHTSPPSEFLGRADFSTVGLYAPPSGGAYILSFFLQSMAFFPFWWYDETILSREDRI